MEKDPKQSQETEKPQEQEKTEEKDTQKTPKDIRTEIFESGSPLMKEKNKSKPKPSYFSQSTHEKVVRSIQEYQIFGLGNAEFLTCRFDYDDSMLAGGAADGYVHIYSLGFDKKEVVISGSESVGSPITCLRWRPNTNISKTKNVIVVTAADGTVAHFHGRTGKLLSKIVEKENQTLCMDFDRDGTKYATAGKDRTIRIYDEATQQKLEELLPGMWNNPGHSNRIFSVKFHPDDANVLISGGWDNTIFFWDLREKKAIDSVYGPAVCGDSLDLKGNYMLTGSYRTKEQLELWDFGKRKKIRDIFWDDDYTPSNVNVYACQFSKRDDKSVLAGCCGIDDVRVFDIDNDYKCFGKTGDLTHPVFSVDFANTMDLFAYSGGDGHIHTVQMKTTTVKE